MDQEFKSAVTQLYSDTFKESMRECILLWIHSLIVTDSIIQSINGTILLFQAPNHR